MSKCSFIHLLLTIVLAREIEGCYTAWGARGKCVNIKTCEPMMRLLIPRPLLPPVLRVLRKAQCGFEGFDPKVCCQTNDHSPNHTRVPPNKIIPYEKHESEVDSTTKTMTTNKITTTETPTTERTTTTARRTTRTERTTTTERPTTTDRKTMATSKTPEALVPIFNHPNRHLLEDDDCGPIAEGRIYGGDIAALYEFPWIAALGYDTGDGVDEFRCGGALISKRYVLTAAHCTTELPDDMRLKKVRLGEYDLSREEDCDLWENGVGYNCAPKYQDFRIERVHVHPDFTRRKLFNDISLIRLSRAADLGPPNVRPICLPLGRAAFLRPKKATVAGWGSTEFGTRSHRLLKVSVPIVGTEECDKSYRYQMIKIWDKQICAGGVRGKDSCSGDSGGPLQALGLYNGRPRMVVYGVVSFGPHSCGVEGHPGVYTSVAHYVGWILDTITE